MDITISTTPLGRHRTDAAALFCCEGDSFAARVGSAGRAHRAGYVTLVKRKAFRGRDGEVCSLTGAADARIPCVVVTGLGAAAKANGEALRRAAAVAARTARDLGAGALTLVLPEARGPAFRSERAAEALVEGALLGLYRFEPYKGDKAKKALTALTVLVPAAQRSRAARGAREGRVLADAVCFARSLGNEPGNTATPTYLADQAARVAKAHGLTLKVLEEADMRRLGMGALLGVSRGSAEPAKLILLTYEPPARRKTAAGTVALVGKGLTFDTGGISIKPSGKMEDMKFDMCGGAAVIGALQAAAGLQVGVRVVGLVPASENMPGSAAYKPGDILTAMNGTTIEVRSTDAEGRLILADALAYATSRMRPRPKAVVDMATLTGACVVALGDQHGGLVSNDDKLAGRLLTASVVSGDALWRLPLTEGYRKQLESPYADLTNTGTAGAGVLTAAAFLERFAGTVPWAHLDIAGMAWGSRSRGYATPGASGFGVRVIARMLQAWR